MIADLPELLSSVFGNWAWIEQDGVKGSMTAVMTGTRAQLCVFVGRNNRMCYVRMLDRSRSKDVTNREPTRGGQADRDWVRSAILKGRPVFEQMERE